MRGAFHHAEILALIAIEVSFEGEIGHADNAVHRRANFMTHVGEKFALRQARGFGADFRGA